MRIKRPMLNLLSALSVTSMVGLGAGCVELSTSSSSTQGEAHKVGSCPVPGGKMVVLCQYTGQSWQEVFNSTEDFMLSVRDDSVCTRNPNVQPMPESTSKALIRVDSAGKPMAGNDPVEACKDLANIKAVRTYPETNSSAGNNSSETNKPNEGSAQATTQPTTQPVTQATTAPTMQPSQMPTVTPTPAMNNPDAGNGTSTNPNTGAVTDPAKRLTFTVKAGVNTYFKKDYTKSGADLSDAEKCVLGSATQGAKKRTVTVKDYAVVLKNSWNLAVTLDEKICNFEPGSQGFLFMQDFEDVPAAILEALGKSNK